MQPVKFKIYFIIKKIHYVVDNIHKSIFLYVYYFYIFRAFVRKRISLWYLRAKLIQMQWAHGSY